jgi:flavin-dependent dehydrogenase
MDDRPVDADLLVVGGGPAGAAAAIAGAERGYRVVLCEREPGGRDRPGETLHPGIEPLLAQLGVADRLPSVVGARHDGIWVSWNGPPRFNAFGSDASGRWRGFQVWRADFDDLLLARAAELGVEIRRACPAAALPSREQNGWRVTTDAGSILARIIVDASGMTRWLGRALLIKSPARSPRLIARYGYVAGSCPARDEAPALVGDATGWIWTARVRPGIYQWTRVTFDKQPDASWSPEELRGLAPVGRSRGADVTWRLATRTAGDAWYMVGDAALTLDPTSSHGVLRALMSGIMAGHLIAGVLGGRMAADAAADAYHAWLAGWFAQEMAKLAQFYRELGATPFAGFSGVQ